MSRPDFIRHWRDLEQPDSAHYVCSVWARLPAGLIWCEALHSRRSKVRITPSVTSWLPAGAVLTS
jgi:hypothetical protein